MAWLAFISWLIELQLQEILNKKFNPKKCLKKNAKNLVKTAKPEMLTSVVIAVNFWITLKLTMDCPVTEFPHMTTLQPGKAVEYSTPVSGKVSGVWLFKFNK